ncbi:MAG: HDOD domain-containing protein [Zoogloeaceae bacterium]|nr:HDOD domain-containing protein [Rhodocyclaceae bacterium]MCP5235905.1 HDOD domain-containing protein [Zoogloeaceae bacterium]
MDPIHDDAFFVPSSVRAAISIRNATEDSRIAETVIERMVASEPMVAAALLRLANSAAYRRAEPADSVSQAIMMLGMGEVRAVASHVAMLQLVRGIRGRAARMVAESLLLHSISVSLFAEELARASPELDRGRVGTLGLFHEMPTFHLLAGSNQNPDQFATLEAIDAVAKSRRLRSLEMLMQDLGLPSLAVPRIDETALIDRAHAYVTHPNPLSMHPDEAGDRSAIAPERIVILQAGAEAAYVTLVEGPIPHEVGEVVAESGQVPARYAPGGDLETVSEEVRPQPRKGLLHRLQTLLVDIFTGD